jgi:glycosyltransferase involved in cell wall biosynthesis
MAMRLPVVATPVMGTAEVIRDGVDGLLVHPKDRESLSVALARLAQYPELRLTVGRNGRERIETAFGLERVAREILGSYGPTLCLR